MNAPRLPRVFSQYLDFFRRVLRRPSRPRLPEASGEETAFDAFPTEMRQDVAPAATAKLEFADAGEPPQASQRLRTLDEVRADLATLRERTRALQAQAQARREMSFAPTDFMDVPDARTSRADVAASGFAPTDFLDFGASNLQPVR